jgi:hypothetical protein
MKNRMLELGTSGSVGGEGGNLLVYPANVGIIRSPIRASILPDCGGRGVILVPTATAASLPVYWSGPPR